MSNFPNNIDYFNRLVNYRQLITETVNVSPHTSSFTINTQHDILSNVSISSPYITEVTTTPLAGQYRVVYESNVIELGPISYSTTLTISYESFGDVIDAGNINDLQDAIEKIEETLGTTPNGAFQDVATRLNHIESNVSNVMEIENFSDQCNGLQDTFQLQFTPKYINVYHNGLLAIEGINYHYIMQDSRTIKFFTPPLSGDQVIVVYWR